MRRQEAELLFALLGLEMSLMDMWSAEARRPKVVFVKYATSVSADAILSVERR